MDENLGTKWPVKSEAPPALPNRHWFFLSLLGAILLIMAILQLFSAADYYAIFRAQGLSAPKAWAIIILIAEIWGSICFFKIPLSQGFRAVSRFFAGAVSLFWLVEALRIFTQVGGFVTLKDGATKRAGANFFGRFLYQMPGWWPIVEATIFLFLVLWALEISRPARGAAATVKVTKKGR